MPSPDDPLNGPVLPSPLSPASRRQRVTSGMAPSVNNPAPALSTEEQILAHLAHIDRMVSWFYWQALVASVLAGLAVCAGLAGRH